MSFTFYVVYQALEWLAALTGFTYKEINVIVFYILVPAVCLALVDKILRKPLCTALFLILLLSVYALVADLPRFAERVFDGSVGFLLAFSNFGISYDLASVVICVIIPLLVFIVLLYLAFPDWFARYLPTVTKIMEGPKGRN
ncbi:MAG TPA: hypothetical protein VK956_12190 [Verrucomicrobium sp.]|nr:hypothetical protein [Verrucomicrobium sp.]